IALPCTSEMRSLSPRSFTLRRPNCSIFSLQSRPVICPPLASAMLMVQSQVPQQRSIAVSPGDIFIFAIVNLRQALCRLKLIISFMISYLGAIFSNTAWTNCSFGSDVELLIFVSHLTLPALHAAALIVRYETV